MKIKEILKETSNIIHKPHIVRFEVGRGCNTGCSFCAIHTIPKEKKYMSVQTAIKVSKSLSEIGDMRFELGMRTDPIINPDIFKIIKIIRKHNSKSSIMMYSNGIALNKEKVKKLFECGVNVVTLDCYTEKNYIKALEEYKEFDFIDYYADKKNKLSPWQRYKPNEQKFFVLRDYGLDISGEKKTRVITNVAGNVDFNIAAKNNLHIVKLEESLKKKCSFPFRDITVTWEGKVVLCCKDWSENKTLFDIMNDKRSLKDYWYNDETLNRIRLLLYNKNREFEPCKYCDYNGGMRLGFLPKLAKLTEKQENIILNDIQNIDLENKELKEQRKEMGRQLYYEK